MNLLRVLPLSLFIGLSACAAVQPPVQLTTSFDPAAVAWAGGRGNNKIEGTALLRTRGGEPRTCAALPAFAIPDAAYTRERMTYIYGSLDRGYNPVFGGKSGKFENESPGYVKSFRQTACDAVGHFEFTDLPDGVYFVAARVIWEIPGSVIPEGGNLMQRVEVRCGETRRVVLAN